MTFVKITIDDARLEKVRCWKTFRVYLGIKLMLCKLYATTFAVSFWALEKQKRANIQFIRINRDLQVQ